jgi:hypothetical protein
MSDIEKDFEKVEEKVRQLMEEAGKLIRQASDFVADSQIMVETMRKYDYDCPGDRFDPLSLEHDDLYLATKPLMDALSYAGWSASSMHC